MHLFRTPSLVSIICILLQSPIITSATPVSCSERTRDLVLRGDLDPSACCSYGMCKGDVNVRGG
ncbi:BgTH12-01809 [Blumeria graminis f. sp. triticale]|uniref:Uncharacterized protein n=2 Tax=Blumeria TaxID=34372 RepID=A0A383UPQ8_BLUHO|nr:BgTH12-01809 [Blumeria graminis f. sp. triticale]SZF01847.1 unnamed protein product [Blumeria hordei]